MKIGIDTELRPVPQDLLYQSYGRGLYRLTGQEETDSLLDMFYSNPSQSTATSITLPADASGSGTGVQETINQGGTIQTATSSGSGLEVGANPSDNIQQQLDAINQAGGGKLFLAAGTYVLPTALTGYSNVEIIGEDETTTTLDFTGVANGIIYSGTNVYTTGTITSITSGVNVTGSGTAWSANAKAGQNLFVGTRWYTIASVTDDTHLVLAEAYGDNVTFPGATYRIATVVSGIVIQDVAIQNSSGTGLAFTDTKDLELVRVQLIKNNIGVTLTNVSRGKIDQIVVASSVSDGIQMTSVGLFNISAVASAGNGGDGFVLNNVKTVSFLYCSSTSNTEDGYNCTTVVDCSLKVETARTAEMASISSRDASRVISTIPTAEGIREMG